MCMCCGILETLALCAGLKVLAVCRKKKCNCPRPHSDSKKIQVIQLNRPQPIAEDVTLLSPLNNIRKKP